MHGRPKLGKERMVTVATRVEPNEVLRLKSLADECGMSLCGYMRELVRLELGRADRSNTARQKLIEENGQAKAANGIVEWLSGDIQGRSLT